MSVTLKKLLKRLFNEKIIPLELAKRLKEAKGMRNILAHQYGVVDDKMVFHSVTEELSRDVSRFIEEIKNKS